MVVFPGPDRTYLKQLNATEGIPDAVWSSLEGRIRDVGRESISQVISRLVRERLPEDATALAVVRDASAIGSKSGGARRPPAVVVRSGTAGRRAVSLSGGRTYCGVCRAAGPGGKW
jgi:hypothetical protein